MRIEWVTTLKLQATDLLEAVEKGALTQFLQFLQFLSLGFGVLEAA